jgi:hypothetical protein
MRRARIIRHQEAVDAHRQDFRKFLDRVLEQLLGVLA